MLTEGIAVLGSLDHKILTSLVNGLMSDALAWSGRQSDAVAALDEALAVSARTGAGWLDAELHRRKAELSHLRAQMEMRRRQKNISERLSTSRAGSRRS